MWLASWLVGEERLAMCLAVENEEPDGVGVGLDGPRALVLGLQRASEAAVEGQEVPRGNEPPMGVGCASGMFLSLGCRGAAG